MGRSVSYPHDAEIVCFRTLEVESWEDEDEDGNTVVNEPTDLDYQDAFDSMLEDLQEYAPTLWPSLRKCDEWIGREDHAILENDFCYMGISEYCGLVALWVKSKADDYEGSWYADEVRKAALARNWVSQIKPKFVATWGDLVKRGTFSNGESFYVRPGSGHEREAA